jgi:predicted metal-dependent phosphoesterase TrpH
VNPFALPGRWLRGNLHTHTDRSDGQLSVREVVERYREAGYDFLAITDHLSTDLPGCATTVTDALAYGGDGLTILPAAELEPAGSSPKDPWDVLAIGLPLDFEPPAHDEAFAAAAGRAHDAGAFVAIPHPWWTNLTPAEIPGTADAIEVWNAATAWLSDRGGSWPLYDQILRTGRWIGAIACDDAHFDGAPAHVAWTMVRAEDDDPETIVAALKSGACYSSQGPEIHAVEFDDDRMTVRCSPAAAVFVTGPSWPFRMARDVAGEASFPLVPDNDWERFHPDTADGWFAGKWVRVTVLDHDGRRAWTNALPRG